MSEEQAVMGFSKALNFCKQGYGITRVGWNGKDLMVRAQYPDGNSKMNLPYLYLQYPESHSMYPNARCPWSPSQTDIMAEDWVVVGANC